MVIINKLINYFFPKPTLSKARLEYYARRKRVQVEGYARIAADPKAASATRGYLAKKYNVSTRTAGTALKLHGISRTWTRMETPPKATYGSQADEAYRNELRRNLEIGDE